jgi:CBS domain-containing protein
MSKAKEIMHWGAECVATSDTLEKAARMMRDGQVGSLPICGPDNRLQGIITDRDIVVKCLAEGRATPRRPRLAIWPRASRSGSTPTIATCSGHGSAGRIADRRDRGPAQRADREGAPALRSHRAAAAGSY